MRRVLVAILFLIMQVCFINFSFVQTDNLKLEQFANEVIAKMKNTEFEDLFDNFYLPKEYTAIDIENDKEAIITGLKELIQNKLGLFEDFSRVDLVNEQVITINMATGSPQTTGFLPSTDLFYKATFQRFGDGYLSIGIYTEGEKLFINNIVVGLLVSNSRSIEIAQDFGKLMMGIAAEQQKRDTQYSPQ